MRGLRVVCRDRFTYDSKICINEIKFSKPEYLYGNFSFHQPVSHFHSSKDVKLLLRIRVSARSGKLFAFLRNKLKTSSSSIDIRVCIIDAKYKKRLVKDITFNCKCVKWTKIAVWSLKAVNRKKTDSVLLECISRAYSYEEDGVMRQIPPLENLIHLMNDLSKLYSESLNTDCVLKARDGTLFPAHRAVLSARSPVFAAMFHHKMLEKQTGEDVTTNVDGAVLKHMLYYMYTGILPNLTQETNIHMYNASRKYDLLDLQVKCLENITSDLKVENICFFIEISERYETCKLEHKIINFLAEKVVEVLGNDKWKEFAMEHPRITNKYVSAALVARIQYKIENAVVLLTRCA